MSLTEQNKTDFFSKQRIIVFLLITNGVSIFLLLNIHYNISKVKKQRQLELSYQDTLRYDDNPFYTEQTELFKVYKTQKANIVMLGSSFTQRVHWNELLERNDIANRGIGSDVSEGYLHRLQHVTDLSPGICFVEVGANDLVKNIPLDTIFEHTKSMIQQLTKVVPVVVLTKCFFVTDRYPDFESYNMRVEQLNALFDKLPSVTLIDINAEISANKKRKREYALADGIHLNAAACLIWKKEIERVLLQKNRASK